MPDTERQSSIGHINKKCSAMVCGEFHNTLCKGTLSNCQQGRNFISHTYFSQDGKSLQTYFMLISGKARDMWIKFKKKDWTWYWSKVHLWIHIGFSFFSLFYHSFKSELPKGGKYSEWKKPVQSKLPLLSCKESELVSSCSLGRDM